MTSDFVNPADQAIKYLDQIEGKITPYYTNYINHGNKMGNSLEDQYSQIMSSPGQMINKFGQDYQKSPGYDFALKQALQAAGNAAAAGGRAGSPAAQEEAEEYAHGLANQDYNNYLQNVLNLYGQGLQGGQSMYNTGFQASNELAQSIANSMLSKAQLSYEGQNAANQRGAGKNSFLSGLGTIGGGLIGAYFGGPIGASIGSSVGGSIFGGGK